MRKEPYRPTAPQRALHDAITALREERHESLTEFGISLAKFIGREKPLSRQYVHMLASGEVPISDDIRRGLEALLRMQDGVTQEQAEWSAQEQVVYVRTQIPAYALVEAVAVRCCYPGCTVDFVPRWPMSRLCPTHRAPEWRNEYRKQQRAAKKLMQIK